VEELTLTFFPLPHVYRGERRDGTFIPWASRCSSCDQQCEVSREAGLRLCSYGVNYQRVDADLLIAGVVVRDYPGVPTPARRRAIANAGRNTVERKQLEATVARAQLADRMDLEDIRRKKDEVLAEYRQTEEYKRDVVELLRPDLQRTLGQVHDYKAFVQQIVQNIDVILETRFPGESIDEKLAKAEHEEAAIYWAAQLMDEKLDVALFLLNPERIHSLREDRPFRFHGLVTKYRKIYQRQADAKGLTFVQAGDSYASVDGNSRALAVIVHAFIDNAVKYAPAGSKVVLAFEETSDSVRLAIESLGPIIKPDERQAIFDLFVRGEEATRAFTDGTGFGLASAKLVADALGLQIGVDQSSTESELGQRETTAWMIVPKADVRSSTHPDVGKQKQRPRRASTRPRNRIHER
jgi:signal transduction histidine kinase